MKRRPQRAGSEARRDRARSEVRLLDEWFETSPFTQDSNPDLPTEQMTLVCWKVQGKQGGNNYLVQVQPEGEGKLAWQCSCPDFSQRQLACKHIFFIKEVRLSGESKDTNDLTWLALNDRLQRPPTEAERALLLS